MSEANVYSIINNPLLQDPAVIQAAVDNIQSTLETLTEYTPAEVNTFVDWSYDAGDIVTLVNDASDYVMPIFSNIVNWNGAGDVTWTNSGNEVRELPTVTQRQTYAHGTAIQAVETEVAEVRYDFETAIEQTDTYIRLIATETDVAEAQTVGKSLFQITSGEIQSVVVQSGVTSALEEFDPDKAYAVGDQVAYEGVWLEFIQPHQAGTPMVWSEVKTVKTQETRITENTSGVELLVTKTGISGLGQGETLLGKIGVEAGRIDLIVQNVGADGSVTAASIVTAINEQDSSSFVALDADTIYLNGQSIVMTGETAAYALTAAEMQCDYFYMMNTGGEMGISCDAYFYKDVFLANDGGTVMVGDGDGNGSITGPLASFNTVRFEAGQNNYDLTATNVPGMVTDLQLLGPTNNQYTLQKKTVGNTSWANVGTFSRATSLGGSWSGSTQTITATPQGNTYITSHDLRFAGDGQHSDFSIDMYAQGTDDASMAKRGDSLRCYMDSVKSYSSNSTVNVRAGSGSVSGVTTAYGLLPLYLYVDSDYAYVSRTASQPSGPSDSDVVAYKTNPAPPQRSVDDIWVRDANFSVSGSVITVPVTVKFDDGTYDNSHSIQVKVNVTNYTNHEYNVYCFSPDYSDYISAYPYYGNYTFSPTSAWADVTLYAQISTSGSSPDSDDMVAAGNSKWYTVLASRGGASYTIKVTGY